MYVVRDADLILQDQLDSVGYTTPASESGLFFVVVATTSTTDAGVVVEIFHPVSSKRHVLESEAMKELKTLNAYQA